MVERNPNVIYGDKIIGGMANNLAYRLEQTKELEKYFIKNGNTLDIGCGNGAVCSAMESIFNCKAFGVDASLASCKIVKKSCQVDVVKGLPFIDNAFDLVTIYEVFEHVSSPYAAVNELKRVLKYDSLVHISVPDYENQHGYGSQRHAFIYPGLFKPEFFEIFLRQMWLDPIFVFDFMHPQVKHAKHWYYVCVNVEPTIDIVDVISKDCDENLFKNTSNRNPKTTVLI